MGAPTRAVGSALLCSLAIGAYAIASGRGQSHDELPRRQAEDAVEMLRLGRVEAVWPLLRQSTDNSRRSFLTHRLASAAIDPAVILRQVADEKDTSARRALVLSLGSFTGDQIPEARRQELVARLLRWYRDDPDPGVHAAVDWLLRHSRRGHSARRLDWRQRSALTAIDRQLAGRELGQRRWYVTRDGATMIVVRGPVAFRMGAPASEQPTKPAPDAAPEPLQSVRIPRSFAIGSKEVTVAEFRRFLEANPDVKRHHGYADNPDRMSQVLARFSPDNDGPQIAVTWYEAAMYCNWISKQEGLPASEWVYPAPGTLASGLTLPADYLRRRGYRLPTEAEWEYAARAGTTTARFYGSGEALLDEYAWYSKNPPQTRGDRPDPSDPQRTWPVGQLKPNDFGLFDVYGNVWEWTQDRMRDVPEAGGARPDLEDDVLLVVDTQPRVRRSGGFPYGAAMMRSAHRGPITALPTNRRDNVGFRIARTLP